MSKSFVVRTAFLVALGLMLVQSGFGQFKRTTQEEPKVSDSFIRPETNSSWLDFFNPDNFKMRQSYSMSYTASGHQGLALGMYTNSMMYKFSPKLDARVDVSLQHSPYSTFDQRLQNSLTGVFLNRAEVNYHASDNLLFRVSYEKLPMGLYGMYSPYGYLYNGLENPEGY